MANFTALKTAINNAIKTNGNEEITGAILQAILDAMVETLGDSAINDLENALTTEVTNRENAVGDVADDLAAEVQARQALDYNVNNRINAEEYNRQNADAALSQTMSQGFQTLGSQMNALNAAISALNAAYQNGFLYGGIATPSSSPSNNKCFYIALQGGTYTNFGGVGVVEGINIIKNNGGWKVEHIYDQTTLLNEFYLLRQQVVQAITSFDPIVIEGDVTNAPDEEDLTSNANHLLQFKNNAYSPLEFSGLGRKYLRKNIAPLSESAPFNGFVEGVTAEETLSGTPTQIFWDRMNTRFVGIKDGVYYLDWTDSDNYVPVSTSLVYMYNGTPYQWTGLDFIVDETEVPNLVNCLTQDMINEANTIYVIRYDYTLKEDITIPANSVLQFDGGSISGEHTITGTNTGIQAGLVKIFSTDVTLAGTWNVAEAYPEWWGAIAYARQTAEDCSAAIQAALNSPFTTIKFKKGFYYTYSTLSVSKGKYLNFNGCYSRAIIPYAGSQHADTTDNYGAVIWTDRDIDVLKLNITNNEIGNYDPADFRIDGGTFDVSSVNGYSKTVLKFIRGRSTELWPTIRTTILGPNNYTDGTRCTGNAIEFCDPEDGVDNLGSFYGGYYGGIIVGFKTAVKNSIVLNTYLNNVVFDFIIDAIKIAYDFGSSILTDGNVIYGSIQTRTYTEQILKGNTMNCLFDAAVWDFTGYPFEHNGVSRFSPKLGARALTRLYELKMAELSLLARPNVFCGNNAFSVPAHKNYIKGLDNTLYRTKKYSVNINGDDYASIDLFNNYETFVITNENIDGYTATITIDNLTTNFGGNNIVAFFLKMREGSNNYPTFNNIKITAYNSNAEVVKEESFIDQPAGASGAKVVGIFNTFAEKVVVTLSEPSKVGNIYINAEMNIENSNFGFDNLIYNDFSIGYTADRPDRWKIGNKIGFVFFDRTLGKPIWHKGGNTWVDATGATV